MFDTYVTVVGNVLTKPEWRRTNAKDVLVANFKVASTARRLDRENGRWIDGNSLRVRVNCWRKLAEGVVASVAVGDPVVVAGRLYTRDWTDAEGNHRALYELEAVAVGHDLSRGRGSFARNKPTMATSAVEDADADSRVHGQPTDPVPDDEMPVHPGEGVPELDPEAIFAPLPPAPDDDELAALRGSAWGGPVADPGGDEPDGLGGEGTTEAPDFSTGGPGVDDASDAPLPADGRSRRRRSRDAVGV